MGQVSVINNARFESNRPKLFYTRNIQCTCRTEMGVGGLKEEWAMDEKPKSNLVHGMISTV